ncbi:MAG TPA: PAS domain-containing protein [bacterium]|nr:PAS domain-containing protein [bacterium]
MQTPLLNTSVVVPLSVGALFGISCASQDSPPPSPSNPGSPFGLGDGNGSGNGGGRRSSFPLERAEEMRSLLNALPYPAAAFESQPGVDTGRVLLANERLEVVLGHTPAEAARLSLQNFLFMEELPHFEEGLRRLSGGGAVYLDVKCRSKANSVIDARMTLSPFRWAGRTLGLCFIEDTGTCRKTLASLEKKRLERPREEDAETGIFEYSSLVLFSADIRKTDSKFHDHLKMPLKECRVIEIRLTRTHSADLLKDPAQNTHVKTTIDLLNMFTQRIKIPEDKRIVFRFSPDGGKKWEDLFELVRGGNRFKPVAAHPAAREAS